MPLKGQGKGYVGFRGPLLENQGGLDFFEINIFVLKMGEINKWPEDMVEINIFSTKEVERAIIYIPEKIFPANPAVKKKFSFPFVK